MSDIPSDLLYTKTHEWVRQDTDDLCTIGITDIAQELLGELVFVELPAVGKQFSQGEECAVVESVKAASDIYLPIEGTIEEVNQALIENPEWVNTDPYESGWLFKIRLTDPKQITDLLSPQEYEEIAEEEAA
jgi:glycine cleavage system H protein